MSLRIRLLKIKRHGQKLYRVIVSEKDGKVLDSLGYYQPKSDIKGHKINQERLNQWITKGALVLPSVQKILNQRK